jgi:hypothetical protein
MKLRLTGNLVEGYIEVKDEGLKEYLENNKADRTFLKRAMIGAAIALSMKVIGEGEESVQEMDNLITEISERCDNIGTPSDDEEDANYWEEG